MKCMTRRAQSMKTVCVNVFSSELSHLKNSKVKKLATVQARERANPTMEIHPSKTVSGSGCSEEQCWNLEQISCISEQEEVHVHGYAYSEQPTIKISSKNIYDLYCTVEPLLKGTLEIRPLAWLITTCDWVQTLYKYILLFSPWNKDTSVIRTIVLVPRVSILERLHCILLNHHSCAHSMRKWILTTRIAKLVRWLQLQVTTLSFTSTLSQPSVVHSEQQKVGILQQI